jgi:hypothetical protein
MSQKCLVSFHADYYPAQLATDGACMTAWGRCKYPIPEDLGRLSDLNIGLYPQVWFSLYRVRGLELS